MRRPRRTPVFGRRPTTLSTTPRDSSPLGSARDHVQEPGGTAAIMDGRNIQDDGDVCVAVGGVAPHVSTRLAPVAANAHMRDRGTPPAGLMRQAPDHRVTRNALAPAARHHRSSPVIRHADTAWSGSMRWPVTSRPRSSRRVNALRSGRSKIVLAMSRSFRWTV